MPTECHGLTAVEKPVERSKLTLSAPRDQRVCRVLEGLAVVGKVDHHLSHPIVTEVELDGWDTLPKHLAMTLIQVIN